MTSGRNGPPDYGHDRTQHVNRSLALTTRQAPTAARPSHSEDGAYLTGALPAAPARVDYTHGITDWGMMLNDQLGCCTIAAVGHAVQTWTANAMGRELTVPDSAILEHYEKWDGYNPADPSTRPGRRGT